MNDTFTKDDGVEASPKPTTDIPDFRPDLVTSTPKQNLNSTLVMSLEEPIEQEVEEKKHAEIESLAGCSLMDVIVMKHTTKYLTDIVKRLLESDEFEVRKCSDGSIVSQGRTSNFGLNGGAGSIADEEYQRVVKERDQARMEADKMHENYTTLYTSFNNIREAANDIRGEYEDAAEKLKLAAAEVDEWKAKFLAVKSNANDELERASREYDDLVKTHEDNTKGLRLRVKRTEIEIASKNDELAILKNRVAELSQICDQLINDVDVSDSESRISAYEA